MTKTKSFLIPVFSLFMTAFSCDNNNEWFKKIQGHYKVYELSIDGKLVDDLISDALIIDQENSTNEIMAPNRLSFHVELARTHDHEVHKKRLYGTFEVVSENGIHYLVITGTYLEGKYEIKYDDSSSIVEFVSDKNYIKAKHSLKKYD